MARWNGRILFIDGFAGPGKYDRGEDGSPVIALNALRQHPTPMAAEVLFMFIEKDRRRAAYLQTVVNDMASAMPGNVKTRVIHGAFDETMAEVLNSLDAQAKQLAPCFVMVDPFGVSGTPMTVIERILKNPKSEVYVSFMYESINRWKAEPEFESHLDQLFGTPGWRKGLAIEGQHGRKEFFFGLYAQQLRHAGARYVTHFELYEGERLVYAIFFGTQSLLGCDKMKQAIWKVAPFGDFVFRGTKGGQLGLDLIDFEPLKAALRKTFGGRGWVTIQDCLCQSKRGALVNAKGAQFASYHRVVLMEKGRTC
jgi:three-Cys-motif partner protein